MTIDPLVAAANAISTASPNTRKFAQLAAQRIIALEQAAPAPAVGGYLLTLQPNYNNGADANDVANNYNAVWVWSNNAQGYAPPNGRDPYRVLLLDPRLEDANGKAGCDEWWFIINRMWPASFDPNRHGQWGNHTTFHNVASNSGPNGGVGWGFGSGVSALTLNWLPGRSAPTIGLEYVKSGGMSITLPTPTRSAEHEYIVRFVAGRVDGSTPRAGEVDILADGAGVATLRSVNTIQSAQAPDGSIHVQQWLAAAWDGDYTKDLANPSTVGFQLTRAGRTLPEALADVPVRVADTSGTQKWNGKQPNNGAPSLVAV